MGPPHAHHPRALTCARRLRPTRPLRSTAAAWIRSQVLSLRPWPLPPPAGAPCLSSGRHGAPDAAAGGGAARPRLPKSKSGGEGAGRCARGRGPRGCAQNQARIRPRARGARRFQRAPSLTPPQPGGGGGSPWPATPGREPEGRLEIRGWPPRECRLLIQGHTAEAAVAQGNLEAGQQEP